MQTSSHSKIAKLVQSTKNLSASSTNKELFNNFAGTSEKSIDNYPGSPETAALLADVVSMRTDNFKMGNSKFDSQNSSIPLSARNAKYLLNE